MRQLEMKIPILEAMEQMPQYAKYPKTLLGNKIKLIAEVVTLPEQVSALIQGTWAKNKKHRGPFVLPITLGKLDARGALANLISLMPMSFVKQLSLELKPSGKTNYLANRSIKFPYGEF